LNPAFPQTAAAAAYAQKTMKKFFSKDKAPKDGEADVFEDLVRFNASLALAF